MIYSDSIFCLIKSLNKNEKGYFKKFASLHGRDSIYVKLFNAIDKQKQYDEKKIRKKFENEKFTKQLSVSKNYLYKLILKSMRSFYSGASVETRLNNNLTDISFLIDKGLYSDADKETVRAKHLSVFYQKHYYNLLLLKKQRELMKTKQLTEAEIKAKFNEEKLILNKINNISDYGKLSWQVFNIVRAKGFNENVNELKAFTKNSLLRDNKNAITFESKIHFNNIHSAINYYNSDVKKFFKYCHKNVELMESYPQSIDDDPERYIDALYNVLYGFFEVKKYDEVESYLKKLENVKALSNLQNAKKYFTYYSICLLLFLKTHRLKEAESLVPEIEEILNKYKDKMSKEEELLFYINIVTLYFRTEEYSKGLKWVNIIINDNKINLREDVQCAARMLNLIIHFELGNYVLLGYIVKSTYRYLYKRKNLNPLVKLVLTFMKKLPEIKDNSQLKSEFTWLKDKLKRFTIGEDEKIPYGLLYTFYWLCAKTENKKFEKIVQDYEGN